MLAARFAQCRALQTRSFCTARAIHAQAKTVASSSRAAGDAPLATKGLKRYGPQYITYKPITPGIRHLRRPINSHLYEGRPLIPLTHAARKRGGRNTTTGKITVRFRGGGHKRRIRHVDFKRLNGDPHEVLRIEYDPGRSAHIALVKRMPKKALPADSMEVLYSYILAPDGLKTGDVVQSFRQGVPDDLIPGYKEMLESAAKEKEEQEASAEGIDSTSSIATLAIALFRAATVKTGNVLLMHQIPTGTVIHNITLDPNGRGILCRSAGSQGLLVAHEPDGKYAHVSLLLNPRLAQILTKCRCNCNPGKCERFFLLVQRQLGRFRTLCTNFVAWERLDGADG
jgi:ribosomal protein L2